MKSLSGAVPFSLTRAFGLGSALAVAVILLISAPAGATIVAQPMCPAPTPGHAGCAGQILVNTATGADALPADTTGVAAPQTGSPAWLQWAYDLEGLSATDPTSTDTVAVVDPYGYAAAQSDLATYRAHFNLPPCGTGCFMKVDQNGGTSYPADPTGTSNSGWITETSLDLDMVSAICPNCHILLVQANTDADKDLATAESTAESLAPQQISDSWLWQGNANFDSIFDPSAMAIVAASGDGGYDDFGVPAELATVTAAGGTSLPAVSNTRGFAETAWDNTASGCVSSPPAPKPSWQTDTGCLFRTMVDLAADSDVNTGVIAYNTPVANGYFGAGGTSAASPMIAAYYALVGGGAGDGGASWAYSQASALNDITSGSDGSCSGSYLCTARAGYDGPTGVGTISGDVLAGPPEPAGAYATAVTATSALLNGGAYANQVGTQVLWQYGLSTAYGQSTPASSAGAGSGATPVSAVVTGLTPGDVYHFRLVASNGCGTSYGYDATLTASTTSTTTTTTSSPTTTTTSTSTTSTCPPATTSTTTTSSPAASTSTSTSAATSVATATATTAVTITRSASTATASVTTSRTTTSTSATATIAALRVSVGASARHKGPNVLVPVRCSRRCAGRLTLKVAGKVIGELKIALHHNGFAGTLAVALNAHGRRLLGSHRRMPGVVLLALNGHLTRHTLVITDP